MTPAYPISEPTHQHRDFSAGRMTTEIQSFLKWHSKRDTGSKNHVYIMIK